MSAWVRNLQIDLVLDNPNDIITFFNTIWNSLNVIEVDVYHNDGGEFIYYQLNSNGKKEWIFYWDNKNERFICNHDRYWLLLELKYWLRFVDIKAFTKLLVENALNSTIPKPQNGFWKHNELMENALKMV